MNARATIPVVRVQHFYTCPETSVSSARRCQYPELVWVLQDIHTRTRSLCELCVAFIHTRNFCELCTPVPQHPEHL